MLTSAMQEQVEVVVDTSSLSGKSSGVSLETAGTTQKQKTQNVIVFVDPKMNASPIPKDPAACESRTQSQLIQKDARGPEYAEVIESSGKRKSSQRSTIMNAQITSTNEAELQQAGTDCIMENMHRVVSDSELGMDKKEADHDESEISVEREKISEQHEEHPPVPPSSCRYGQI